MAVDNSLLKLIPKVDDMINNEKIAGAAQNISRPIVVEAIREVIDETREKILNAGEYKAPTPDADRLAEEIILRFERKNEMNLRKVINATGVILHTNLGRAPLSGDIRGKVWEIAENYSTLEYNIRTGERGSRYDHVSGLITKITGAEAAFAVNNNAAAVVLVLNTLAKGSRVIVSRGELVEIGESFRLPDILKQSGAELIEIGSTNKTRLPDYENALMENGPAVLLKVHTSNYKIVGFTEEVSLTELVGLGRKYSVSVIHDLGSGALIDFGKYGITGETTVQESVSAGADLVCFSGDKLLGGPQAGIIAGKKSLIDKIKKNPLTRAFRIDKLTLAALEATLRLYIDPENAVSSIPSLSMMTMPPEIIYSRADNLHAMLKAKVRNCAVSLEDGYSQVGGGSLPLLNLPARIVKIKPERVSTQELEEHLRDRRVPIIVTIRKDQICLDVRTVALEDFPLIVNAFEDILN